MLTVQTSHVQASPEIVILPSYSSYITGRSYVVGEVMNVGEDAPEFVKRAPRINEYRCWVSRYAKRAIETHRNTSTLLNPNMKAKIHKA